MHVSCVAQLLLLCRLQYHVGEELLLHYGARKSWNKQEANRQHRLPGELSTCEAADDASEACFFLGYWGVYNMGLGLGCRGLGVFGTRRARDFVEGFRVSGFRGCEFSLAHNTSHATSTLLKNSIVRAGTEGM